MYRFLPREEKFFRTESWITVTKDKHDFLILNGIRSDQVHCRCVLPTLSQKLAFRSFIKKFKVDSLHVFST